MKIGELCNREVVIASKDTKVIELASLMREHHVGDIVITKNEAGANKPIGIVTDRDLVVEIIAKEVPLSACNAGDIMSDELVTLSESEGMWEAIDLMRDKGIRRLPVVSESGALVGIVCVDDLHAYLTERMQSVVSLINREQRREEHKRH